MLGSVTRRALCWKRKRNLLQSSLLHPNEEDRHSVKHHTLETLIILLVAFGSPAREFTCDWTRTLYLTDLVLAVSNRLLHGASCTFLDLLRSILTKETTRFFRKFARYVSWEASITTSEYPVTR